MGSGYVDSRDIMEKIEGARRAWASLKGVLYEGSGFVRLLRLYRMEIDASWALMARLGVGGHCARCSAERVEGGCCSQSIEEWYEEPLLVVNLALGAGFPEERAVEGGCLFLGRQGCILPARHNFCVNYLCPGLKESLGQDAVERLQRQYGRELSLGWECELMVIRALEGLDG